MPFLKTGLNMAVIYNSPVTLTEQWTVKTSRSNIAPSHRPVGHAALPEFVDMMSGWPQGFALASSFPYTYRSTRPSTLSEGADHGNAHNLPLG